MGLKDRDNKLCKTMQERVTDFNACQNMRALRCLNRHVCQFSHVYLVCTYVLPKAFIQTFLIPFLFLFQYSPHTILDCNEASIWSEFQNTGCQML